ncbi:MAG: hypothetical protein GYB35_15490 [Algicola sp.]|nr:hypothetical protein [Algicola sp.]
MPKNPLVVYKLENEHDAKVTPMWVMMVYLRQDSSFIMGSCDLQIWEAGNYLFEGDSLLMYNIYSFKDEAQLPDRICYYDKQKKSIFYRYPNKLKNDYPQYDEMVAILEHGFLKGHSGFLRNENWSLDSLYRYNVFLPYDEQMIWVDSALSVSKYNH